MRGVLAIFLTLLSTSAQATELRLTHLQPAFSYGIVASYSVQNTFDFPICTFGGQLEGGSALMFYNLETRDENGLPWSTVAAEVYYPPILNEEDVYPSFELVCIEPDETVYSSFEISDDNFSEKADQYYSLRLLMNFVKADDVDGLRFTIEEIERFGDTRGLPKRLAGQVEIYSLTSEWSDNFSYQYDWRGTGHTRWMIRD